MHRLLLLVFFIGIFLSDTTAQYDIDISLLGYENDTVVIGNYYGDRTLVKDTIYREANGKFKLHGPDTLASGVYLILLKPDNNYSQFLVNGIDNEFEIEWEVKDPTAVKITGSKDNELFYEYMRYLEELRPRADKLKEKIAAAKEAGKEDKKAVKKLDELDVEVKAFQSKIVQENPDCITSMFIKSTLQIDIPEYEGSEEEKQLKAYRFYKKHYFDNIDLGNPAALRTPFINDRVDYYMEKLTVKDPDSIIESIDYLLEEMTPAPETFRFYTSYLINKYANMKVVGMDAVYVHMVDKYYRSGRAHWVDDETLGKMKSNATNLRPILIGKTFPAVTTYKADNTPVEINKIESEYLVVLFWAHTCGHCTKSMPDVVKFYDEYESKGVTLVSVCTKGGEKTKPCMEAVPDKNMEKFINTFDENQRYRRKVYINTTPKIFILDKNKKILVKDIPAKELSNVMENIMKIDTDKESKAMEK